MNPRSITQIAMRVFICKIRILEGDGIAKYQMAYSFAKLFFEI